MGSGCDSVSRASASSGTRSGSALTSAVETVSDGSLSAGVAMSSVSSVTSGLVSTCGKGTTSAAIGSDEAFSNGVTVAVGIAGAASSASATCADSAKRSSSSGLRAPRINSARSSRLLRSLSLKPNGSAEKASSRPITRRRPHSGTATMERAPNWRQADRFTRSSVSVSSQRMICAVRKHAPEKAESRWMRAPTSGLIVPAEARRTISLFSARAIPRPSAPVMAMARSATSCSTSSRTNCSPASNSMARAIVSNPL